MVVLSDELDYIESNWIARMLAAITTIKVGDDGTTPTASDTDLGNTVDSASITETDTSVANKLSWTTNFGITAFVGSTIRESAVTDGTDSRTRNLTPESLKAADEVFWVEQSVEINAINKS